MHFDRNAQFKTSNGIIRQENAILKNAGTDDEELEIRGTITWVDVDGKENSIVFVANKDGYQPQVSP
ncbi:Endocuticle structural protein SgAbd-6 [Gryllus bimaculatus]|nr:Endocuticle structural protein SgAbd-6 [Gryllus bimaculatus]